MAHTDEIPPVVEVPEDDVAQEELPMMPPPTPGEAVGTGDAGNEASDDETHPVESDKLPPIPA